jgi:hypothetical protein
LVTARRLDSIHVRITAKGDTEGLIRGDTNGVEAQLGLHIEGIVDGAAEGDTKESLAERIPDGGVEGAADGEIDGSVEMQPRQLRTRCWGCWEETRKAQWVPTYPRTNSQKSGRSRGADVVVKREEKTASSAPYWRGNHDVQLKCRH